MVSICRIPFKDYKKIAYLQQLLDFIFYRTTLFSVTHFQNSMGDMRLYNRKKLGFFGQVCAIDATRVVVTFTKPVSKASLFADGVSGAFKQTAAVDAVTFTTIDGVSSGTLTGSLSADGKTLTVTATNSLSKRYDVVVKNLSTTSGDAVESYVQMVTFGADAVAPTILGTERISASQVKVKFSEPLQAFSPTFTYTDGTTVTGTTGTVAAGATEATFTMDATVTANKTIVATFIGAQDQAGNLITPNPATVSFTKGVADGVVPTVTSLTALNNKTIEVKFSEQLSGNPTVTGFAGNLTFTQNATDKTKYTVTSDTVNTGLKAVGITAGYSDLTGEVGAAFSKVVNFDLDTINPKVASSTVTTVSGIQYLEVTFDEVVETEASLVTIDVTGTMVSNYVTSPTALVSVPVAKFVQDATNKKVYRIALTDLLGANDTEDATYSLTLTGKTVTSTTVKLVNDVSGNAGPSSTVVSVTRNADSTSNNNQASLDTTLDGNGIKVNADKTITVRFNQELDGASALTLSNYNFSGAVVEKAELSAYNTPAGKQDVTLTLKDGSNLFTGLRNVTISGVKAKNGLAMTTVNTTENLVENVAPTVSSAKLTAPGTITLTFSEAVYNANDVAAGDFDLYIGGNKVTATTLDTEDVLVGDAKTTLTLTVGGSALTATDLAAGLSIKPVTADTLDIKDASDNNLSVVSVSVGQ